MKFLFCVLFLSLTTIFGSNNPNILENAMRCERNSNFNQIYLSHGQASLKDAERFFNTPWQPQQINQRLENKTFGITWKGFSTTKKLTEILQNYINQKKNSEEIIFNVPVNASYQRCMRADFLENINQKNNQLLPEPNFDRLRILMNISYTHFMYVWTSKSIEKNYNKAQDSIPDEIQDAFKLIKKHYFEEVKNYINLFFAKIDPKSINLTELEEQSKQVIPVNLVKNIRKLYELITDFVDVRNEEFKNENRRTDYSGIITADTLLKYIVPEKYNDIQTRKEQIAKLSEVINMLNYQHESKKWGF